MIVPLATHKYCKHYLYLFHRQLKRDFNEILISLVEENEPLWRKSSKLYKDKNIKINCWLKIFHSLKSKFGLELLQKWSAGSPDQLKLRWQNKRDQGPI
jgi:hypothetical protein